MVILVDMDDVLEQLVEAIVEYNNSHYGTNVRPGDVVEWNLAKAFPTLTREMVYSPEYDENFWAAVEPMPGADRVLRRLMDEGHEIYVVTASTYETLKQKMDDLLFRYFPFLDWKHVIITSNKHMISGDVLIDDGPHNLTGGSFRKILFDRPHNRSFDEKSIGAVRVYDWDDVYEQICLLTEKSE
ncbi:MAG: hypothetical protein IJJ22_04445 [Oscillospiraceae bacterium]|nr:hypothetical protein [Oscillospiraceae bacterium]